MCTEEGYKVNYMKIKMTDGNYDTSSESNLVSSSNMGDDNIIIIEESSDPQSITGILNVCKKKLLVPYMRLLSLVGLRPLYGESSEPHIFYDLLNVSYKFQIIFFLLAGYVLQYCFCFRRDTGYVKVTIRSNLNETARDEEQCNGLLIYNFIIPSILHFGGYFYALITVGKKDNDQLPTLIERVFLISSHVPNIQINQKYIIRTFWFWMIGSFLWIFSSISLVSYTMAEANIPVKWIDNDNFSLKQILKILLVIGITWQDICQISVISNYCLQAQLLKAYIDFLKRKLLQQPPKSLDWIKELDEFRKLVFYLNSEITPPICLLTIINWTYAISGSLWILFTPRNLIYGTSFVNIANVILWWFIAFIPLLQAARLTSTCRNMKTLGQEVTTRAYVNQDSSLNELNSILIYNGSLKIDAKLFNIPISGKYMGISCAFLIMFILVYAGSH